MKRENILSMVLGLAISLMISGVVYYILFLETFDMFGIESTKNPEGRHGKILLTAVSASLFTLAIAGMLRKKKFAAIGFAIPSLIGIFIMIAIGPIYLNKSNYYEPFDKQKWITEGTDRMKMARQLIRDKELIDLTRDQVTKKLGPGDLWKNTITYSIWGDDCGLEIVFLNDRVSDCGIYVKD